MLDKAPEMKHVGLVPVTVIMTVKDDVAGCETTLGSLRKQTRQPDEIVVVDGGSAPGAVDALRERARDWPCIKVIEAAGANIAAGRNIATRAAQHDLIASIDAGCRAENNWLERLVAPFQRDESVGFVAGNYLIEPRTLFEEVAGLATMRGQLEPVSPETFNPSARSLAYHREVWRRAGGWPEWIRYSEDTLFDERVRRLEVRWAVAADAVVHWRPRTSWRGLAKQFYNYGTGRGHTQMGGAASLYNLRNLALLLVLGAASLLSAWFVPLVLVHALYFYVWAFHAKCVRITKKTGRLHGYVLAIAVHWVVLISHLTGFLVGSMQRFLDKPRYGASMDAYLAGTSCV